MLAKYSAILNGILHRIDKNVNPHFFKKKTKVAV